MHEQHLGQRCSPHALHFGKNGHAGVATAISNQLPAQSHTYLPPSSCYARHTVHGPSLSLYPHRQRLCRRPAGSSLWLPACLPACPIGRPAHQSLHPPAPQHNPNFLLGRPPFFPSLPLFISALPHPIPPLPHSSPLPMAVSSWNTAGVLESRGLMVFLFLMSGSFRAPPLAASVSCRRRGHHSARLTSGWHYSYLAEQGHCVVLHNWQPLHRLVAAASLLSRTTSAQTNHHRYIEASVACLGFWEPAYPVVCAWTHDCRMPTPRCDGN